MKYVYKTELEWMQRREQIEADGFFIKDGKKFLVEYLDSYEKLEGYDFYTIAFTDMLAGVKWQRAEIAGAVEENLTISDAEGIQEMFEYVSNIINKQPAAAVAVVIRVQQK
jgi:hypothetical protein